MSKERLDAVLAARGLAESREKARRLILAGQVRVDGQVVDRPDHGVPAEARLDVAQKPRYVGRGGDKLDAAVVHFGLRVKGRVCLDVGASTGGFTDCLLQYGAARVYAVDVGKGQLAWSLRQDSRVVVMEEVNARYLRAGDFPERPNLAAADVSFISLTKVLPAVINVLAEAAELVTLIKPQFEAGRDQVGKGGVVRNAQVRESVVEAVRLFGTAELGLEWGGCIESPLKGPAGNVEFLAYWKRGPAGAGGGRGGAGKDR